MEHPSQKLIEKIEQIVSLLKLSSSEITLLYMRYLMDILDELNRPHDLEDIANKVLAIYGGMGSFGDINVYHKDMDLKKEDLEFRELREELFILCKETIFDARGALDGKSLIKKIEKITPYLEISNDELSKKYIAFFNHAIERLRSPENLKSVAISILESNGAEDSFAAVRIYKNGVDLFDKEEEFNKLRFDLFEFCSAIFITLKYRNQ